MGRFFPPRHGNMFEVRVVLRGNTEPTRERGLCEHRHFPRIVALVPTRAVLPVMLS